MRLGTAGSVEHAATRCCFRLGSERGVGEEETTAARDTRRLTANRPGRVAAGVYLWARNPSCDVPNNRAVTSPTTPAVDYMGWAITPPLPLGI
jgi:hypothetical protein